MSFKKDFIWGAATASYQVEGAAYEDSKGLSIWDVFCKESGHIFENHTGDIACNQYHLYKDDVGLMKQLGLKAYRFSISWSRLLPYGTGEVNQKGIDYYNNLIDELFVNNIQPFITLYHWDLPYELQKKGGWLNEDSIQWFSEYACLISKHFSDRVTHYFTFNEPQCFINLGYISGEHAPGYQMGCREYLQICHNVLRAHGAGVIALRNNAKQPLSIGYAPTGSFFYPSSDSEADIQAARSATFACPDDILSSIWNVGWLSDPIMLGSYPEEGLKKYADYLPPITAEDMDLIHQPLDFFGFNIYNGKEIRADQFGNPVIVDRFPGFPKTAIQWPVTPKCIYWASKFMYERYQKPILITENGMSSHDWISVDGKVHDPNRIDFYHRYLSELQNAASDGVDIAGYFAWSLMDNFEWSKGYSDRFGLIFVDYNTQKRTIKDSGYWYKEVIKRNRIEV